MQVGVAAGVDVVDVDSARIAGTNRAMDAQKGAIMVQWRGNQRAKIWRIFKLNRNSFLFIPGLGRNGNHQPHQIWLASVQSLSREFFYAQSGEIERSGQVQFARQS